MFNEKIFLDFSFLKIQFMFKIFIKNLSKIQNSQNFINFNENLLIFYLNSNLEKNNKNIQKNKKKILNSNTFKKLLKLSLFHSKKKRIFQKNTFFRNLTLVRLTKLENAEFQFYKKNYKLKKKIQKKLLNGYSKIHEIKLVTIGLASPEKIQSWAEKELPNGKIFGEVTNANTFHYKTFKPSKGGLFCERIFGPLKDFSCACGKRKKPTAIESKKILEHEQTSRTFCPYCDVEYTWSILRRYQLGYIKLNAPVTHLWYFKTNPSYLSILFDLKRKYLESIIYCTQTITIENIWKYSEQNSNFTRSPTDLYLKWQKFFNIEQKTKERQMIFENKKEKQRKKKQNFRRFFFISKIVQKQKNWTNFKNQNGLINPNLSSLKKNEKFPLFPFSSLKTKQLDILFNLLKQKQKKFIRFAIKEIWKKFLQKSYRQSFICNTFLEFFIDNFLVNNLELSMKPNNKVIALKHLQKNIENFSICFFFSSSIIPESFLSAKKSFHFFKNANMVSSSFSFFLKNQNSTVEISENFNMSKKKIFYKKKFWKSFFFVLQFAVSIVQQKNKKIKNLVKFSKKDAIFLFNILPFLMKLKIFQNLKFMNKNLKKIHFFLLKSFQKKNYQINLNFFNKIYENIPFKIQKSILKKTPKSNKYSFSLFEIPKKKFFLSMKKKIFILIDKNKKLQKQKNFYGKNQPSFMLTEDIQIILDDDLLDNDNQTKSSLGSYKIQNLLKQIRNKNLFSLKEKIDFFETKLMIDNKSVFDIFTISMHFEKILCLLKTYYEIDFTSLFYNSIFFSSVPEKTNTLKKLSNENINLLLQKNLNIEIWYTTFFEKGLELFNRESQIYSFLEKTFFEYFTFIFYLFKFNSISSISRHSPIFFKNWLAPWDFVPEKNKEENIDLFSEDLKTTHSLFFLLHYFSLVFLSFSQLKNQNLLKTTLQANGIDQFSKNKQLNIQKKIYISNKEITSKLKLHQRKKQIEFAKFLKFFHFDYIVSSEQNFMAFQSKAKVALVKKRKKKIQKIFKTGQKPITKSEKKANFQIFDSASKPNSICMNAQKFVGSDPKNLKPDLGALQRTFLTNSYGQKITKSKAFIPKTNMFLKNKVLTIAYNYIWNNDADWKYFIYYNSLFLNEFDDIPIFVYRSSNFFEKSKNSKKMKNILFNESFFRSKKANESFFPFFDFPIDFSPISGTSTKNFLVGAGIIEKLLTEYTSTELRKMTIQHQNLLPKIQQTLRFLKQTAKTKKDSLKIQKYFQKREHIIRRLKFLRKFSRRNSNPCFMILKNLPVLPPDLRPILKLQNQIAASDLNRFYQRIIYRNERFKKFAKDSATNQSFEIKYAQRLLQEAVDNLIQNGKGSVKAETNSRGQPLKSLSEILKGKQGRFRQYLLGKRVDYSGRSVIVVGPELKLYECGIPKEMALELFLPFLIQYILKYKLAQTVIGAKNLLKSDSTFTLHLLQKILKNVPVLLNRAPTLHRLGFQAFLPKLIEGRAILLHPMVCPAFNADFDGDQMAVHIPLTVEARTEAWKFMLSINNFMNSATGEPILLPSQDMVLGSFFLTNDFLSKFVGIQFSNCLKKQNFVLNKKLRSNSIESNFYNFVLQNKSFLFFNNFSSVITAYECKEIFIHTPIWMKVNGFVDFGNDSSKPVEIRLQLNGTWEKIQPKYAILYDQSNNVLYKYIRTTVGRILMNLMIQDCIYGKFFSKIS